MPLIWQVCLDVVVWFDVWFCLDSFAVPKFGQPASKCLSVDCSPPINVQ